MKIIIKKQLLFKCITVQSPKPAINKYFLTWICQYYIVEPYPSHFLEFVKQFFLVCVVYSG